jgi:hypothetical protein
VLRRLALLRARTGLDPLQLRRLSPHIAKLQDALCDSRAKRVHRQNMIDDEERN